MSALKHKIEQVRRQGDVVVLWTRGGKGKRSHKLFIQAATVEPYVGDVCRFKKLKGKGYIEMDGNRFPYRRDDDKLYQDW